MEVEIGTEKQLLQLRKELIRVKEERCRALRDVEELKCKLSSSSRDSRMDVLQAEAEIAKESERKMLESLVFQTKQLEQTKIMLEEARLENRSLRDSITILESPIAKGLKKNSTTDAVFGNDDIGKLRSELKLASQAEEKSKKALDDLALALKEVTTESNWLKEKLSRTQAELDMAREEMERSRSSLKRTESELQVASDHCRRLKLEAEDSSSTWNEKEKGLIKCIQMLEDEISDIKNENNRSIDSQRTLKEEISKLRDILKQAVSEATVVKEALEIARKENAQLQDLMAQKENELQDMKQEIECLQESEASALETVKELQSLLVSTSSMEVGLASNSYKKEVIENAPANLPPIRKPISKFPSENWMDRDPCSQPGPRRRSLNDSQKFGTIFDMTESPRETDEAAAAARAAKWAIKKKGQTKSFDGLVCFAHPNGTDGAELGFESPVRRKKKPGLRKIGELLMRKNHK